LLSFVDDNAFSSARRIQEVCEAVIRSRISTYWLGFLHTRHIDETNIDLIRRSGLILAMVGVESGDPGQLRRMGRSSDVGRMQRAIELLDASGITPLMYLVLGFPGETEATLRTTAAFLNRLRVERSSASYQMYRLQVLPLSRLGSGPLREELGLTGMWSEWSHPTMSSHQTAAAGRLVFEQVTDLPYHYEDESAAFNRRFEPAARRTLFGLRNRLTRELLDQAGPHRLRATLGQMLATMGYGDIPVPDTFIAALVTGSGCGQPPQDELPARPSAAPGSSTGLPLEEGTVASRSPEPLRSE
jgi:radical SAM superfamily enzyme YgiQ (UPF0313 family)